MTSITIPVPEHLRRWVESRLESGRYASAGDYIRDLIDRDRADMAERETLVAALERGESSGKSDRDAPAILASLKRELGDAAA